MSGNRRNPYRVRVTVGWEQTPEGKSRQVTKTIGYYHTYNEANKALMAYHDNPISIGTDITFADLYEKWSAEKFDGAKESLIKSYQAAFRAVPMLHDQIYRTLKRNHFQNAVDTSGKNYPTLINVKLLFTQMDRYAMENDLIDKEYSHYVNIAKYAPKPEEKVQIHTDIKPEELEILWKNADRPDVQEILMLIYSGLRINEFLTLKPEDIQDRVIVIRDSKTPSGIRRVPISSKTAVFWAQRIAGADRYIIRVDGTQSQKTRYAKYQRQFENAFDDLNLLTHLPHDTRHTCGTMLHAAKVEMMLVKLILGHKIDDVTEKVYIHITDAQLREAIEKI